MKKITLLCMFLCLFGRVNAQHTATSYLLVADSFKDLGTWNFESSGVMGLTLLGVPDRNKQNVKPALATINVKKEGKYKIWGHARDFKNQQGSRFFTIAVNGAELPKVFGKHGEDGFRWVDGGLVDLKVGENEIQLIDKSAFYARCDGIFITNDLEMVPSEDYASLLKVSKPVNLPSNGVTPVFPNWANQTGTIIKETAIENDYVKVVFAKINDQKNGSFIQNEIYIKDKDKWVRVKNKTDDHGYLMLKAENNIKGSWIDKYMIYNIYQKGVPVWLIPTDYEKTDDHKIVLRFKNLKDVEVTVSWELTTKDQDPKVTLNAAFKENGNYSFGLFNGKEYSDEEYENALAPFRIMEKRVPKEPIVFLEHYLFTPMGSVTLPENNSVVPGRRLTTAVVVAPEWIPRGYAYRETARFGIALRGPAGGLRGTLFAPLFGSDKSVFKAGDKYSVSYRVVNRLDTWFNTYKHIAQDIFNVHDYRSNYYTSLNEAIYNTTDLMMDNERGGWDALDKAHYNMEEKDLTSLANPMTAVQRYLLTEDDKILTKRAIPTLVNLLTRVRLHFKRFDSKGGANYLSGVAKPVVIGKPISGYNLNVYGGLYEMTRGLTPELLTIGLENSGKVNNMYGNIPPFANDLALYRYTKNQSYLNAAKDKADKYLLDVVYNKNYNSKLPGLSGFINISYFPNLASLIDIYEVTREKRYLDAAVKTGQMLSTTLWVPGVDGTKGTIPYVIEPDQTIQRPFIANHDFWWYGSVKWRPGNKKGEAKAPINSNTKLIKETVPGWLPSRVGLGLEQGSTFSEALNIYMNTWAGDLMKLSALSGEEYFSIVAKNAIIGRFGNYPGYYQDRYITHQMKADFPYKGPDLTSVYWHHIPPFLSMLEDFLINQVFAKSNQKIEFPAVRQQGYAYFNSNQYGFAPGKFYDLENMWLWNDRGIIEPSSVNINYLPTKKDGVFAVALMNEADSATTTTIKLGDKIKGGAGFTGKATIYNEAGAKQEIDVNKGKFTIEIPAKGMRSVSINIPGIQAPKYASVNYDVKKVKNQKTVAEHTRGKSYIFQLSPEKYFAYIYVTDLPKEAKQMVINYKVGDKSSSVTVKEYPFEAIIEVDDVLKDITYDIEITNAAGKVESIKGSKISPIKNKG